MTNTYKLIKQTHKQVIKDTSCSAYLIRQIINHAGGSMYRLNSGSADCYEFTIDYDCKSWEGGWDWSDDLVSRNSQYIYKFEDKKIYKIIK